MWHIEVKWSCSVVSDSLRFHGLQCPWNSLGQNLVGSLSLLHGIFPTQGLNPGLPHCRQILYQLRHNESPRILEWVAYPFARGSSWPRNRTRVSCIAGGFFTNWAIDVAYYIDFRMLNSPLIAEINPTLWSWCPLGFWSLFSFWKLYNSSL